jgi:ribosomal protein S12
MSDDPFDRLTAERDAIGKQLQPLEAQASRLWCEVDTAQRAYKAVREQIEALKVATDYRGICMRLAAVARGRKGNHSLRAESNR